MTTTDIRDLNKIVQESNGQLTAVREEMAKVIIGQEELITSMLIALLTDGHLLVEGVPGLAKTLAVSTLAKTLELDFTRIQFTPDLLPADLTGTTVYNPKDGTFSVQKGPVFTNIVLADEINRAPAKVQAALLEVMQERQVTLGGETFEAGNPFLVLATQNPIEQEGTYPLPEAQTDRFMMKVLLDYPSRKEEKTILQRMGRLGAKPEVRPVLKGEEILKLRELIDQIYVDEKVTEYILDVIFATREPSKYKVDIEGLLDYGASPRAAIMLSLASKAHAFLEGRGFVTPHDVKSVGHAVLRHRLRRSYEAEAEELSPDDILDRIFETLLVP